MFPEEDPCAPKLKSRHWESRRKCFTKKNVAHRLAIFNNNFDVCHGEINVMSVVL